MVGNYPVTLGIAAAGAAMVRLIEHSLEPSTPADTAWLLAGSVALVLAYAQPPAWLLALGLALDLLVVWLVAVNRWLRVRGANGEADG